MLLNLSLLLVQFCTYDDMKQESLVQEFHSLQDEKLDVQDVVYEAQNLLHLSRPIAAVYLLSRQIVWYRIHVIEIFRNA